MYDGHATIAPEITAPVQFPGMLRATPIGTQALEIIASILEDESSGLAEIKLHLRKCVAAHPGAPERALLAHLMETSQRVNSEGGDGTTDFGLG